jgi:sodium/pantothenate symporter
MNPGWIVLTLYAATILLIVFRGARKTSSIQDFALGSLFFSPVAVGLSLAASMTSAATFIINPGFVALYGWGAFLSMGLALPLAALLSLVILTKGFRKHGQATKALTMAQWMQTRYQSRALGIYFGFLSLLLITFIVLIAVGLTKVISVTLQVSEFNALVGVVVFIFGYMMFGGANSMVYTNTIQAGLMFLVAIVLLGSGYEHFSQGIEGFITKLNAIDPNLTQATNTTSFLFRDFAEIFIAQMIVGVAIVCQPHIVTKSLLLKDDHSVNRYLTVGVTVQFLFFLVVFAGFYARLMFPELSRNGVAIPVDGIIPAYVAERFPVWVGLLVVMGLISAGISTLEGLIQSLSTTITIDLLQLKKASQQLWINRLVIGLMALVTILLAWDQLLHPKLSVGIFAQNGVYAYFSAAFVPILMGLFYKEVPLSAVFAASVVAVVTHFTMYYGQLPLPFTLATGENPGVAAATAIVAALVVGFALKGRRR